MNILEDGTLRRIAMQALRPKAKASRRRFVDHDLEIGRLKLTFPQLTFDNASKFGPSYYDTVVSYLELWEVRTLNDLHLAGYQSPTEGQLAHLFETHVRNNVVHGARYGLSDKDITDLCSKRAHRALIGWTPAYIDRMAQLGRIGGKRSKRTSPLLDRLTALEGMSASQQAEQLGCTPRHVKRLRAQLVETTPIPVSTVMDTDDREPPATFFEDTSPWEDMKMFHETKRADLFGDLTPMDELAIQTTTSVDTYDVEHERAAEMAERERIAAEHTEELLGDLLHTPEPTEASGPDFEYDWDAEFEWMHTAQQDGPDDALDIITNAMAETFGWAPTNGWDGQ